ncbi:hypothetical protein LINPERPRIM_LOCUS6043 [Linum perenne]
MLWDEHKSYRPIPYCDCLAGTYETIMRYQENDRVIKFLLGLNDSFQQVKTQMLMLDPLPDLDTVYKCVIQLERQLSGTSLSNGKAVESIALAAMHTGAVANAVNNPQRFKFTPQTSPFAATDGSKKAYYANTVKRILMWWKIV